MNHLSKSCLIQAFRSASFFKDSNASLNVTGIRLSIPYSTRISSCNRCNSKATIEGDEARAQHTRVVDPLEPYVLYRLVKRKKAFERRRVRGHGSKDGGLEMCVEDRRRFGNNGIRSTLTTYYPRPILRMPSHDVRPIQYTPLRQAKTYIA